MEWSGIQPIGDQGAAASWVMGAGGEALGKEVTSGECAIVQDTTVPALAASDCRNLEMGKGKGLSGGQATRVAHSNGNQLPVGPGRIQPAAQSRSRRSAGVAPSAR